MTVSSTYAPNVSAGNGATTVFPYNFRILVDSDLEVTVNGVVQTLATHYTVSGVGADGGGNVTFLSAPANGASVIRRRRMPLARTTNLTPDLLSDVLNRDQDAPVLIAQQLQEQIDRSVKAPLGESTSMTLQDKASRLGRLFAWDDNTGAPSVTNFTVSALSSAMSSALHAWSTIDLPVFFVDNFAADRVTVGNGSFDDSATFAAASAAINLLGGGVLDMRPGATYRVGGQTMNNPPLNTYYTFPPNVYYPIEFANCVRTVVLRGNGARIKCLDSVRYGTFNTDGTPMATAVGYVGVGASTPYYYMIYAHGCKGVHIENLELDGNLNNIQVAGHFSDAGIQLPMMGMNVANNAGPVTISNVLTHHHGEDGYQVDGPSTGATFYGECGVVRGVHSYCNGRQAMSFVGGKRWLFEGCSFNSTGRANLGSDAAAQIQSNPGSGVDFEAEAGKEIRDITFRNCEFIGNTGTSVVADSGTNVDRIRFHDSTFIGTTNYSVWANRPGMKFFDCLIVGTVAGAQSYPGTGGSDPFQPHKAVKYYRCLFTDDVSLSPTGATYSLNGLLFEGGVNYVEHHQCTFVKTKNTVGGGGNANGMRYVDCVFIAKAGTVTFFGRYEGSETHFIEDGGVIGVPNTLSAVAGKTDTGFALDSWYYSTVVANVATTVRHSATMDRATRDVLGSRTTAIDADLTLTQGTDRRTQFLSGALTANRTITLSGGRVGSRFRIVRTGGGAFNWNVGGLKTLTAANQWCELEHNGTAWALATNGTL